MLSFRVFEDEIEFRFVDFFSKEHLHSESFSYDDAEQIAIDLLDTIKQAREIMDAAIKKEKKALDKGMDKLVKMDKKNDKKHEKIGAKKAMKKKGC